jgi:hypothetical protein
MRSANGRDPFIRALTMGGWSWCRKRAVFPALPAVATVARNSDGRGKRGKSGKRAASVRKNPVETVMTVTMELTVPRVVPAQSSQDPRP